METIRLLEKGWQGLTVEEKDTLQQRISERLQANAVSAADIDKIQGQLKTALKTLDQARWSLDIFTKIIDGRVEFEWSSEKEWFYVTPMESINQENIND